jgi:hypothetical protein
MTEGPARDLRTGPPLSWERFGLFPCVLFMLGCGSAHFDQTGPATLAAEEATPPIGPLPALHLDDPTPWQAGPPTASTLAEQREMLVASAEVARPLARQEGPRGGHDGPPIERWTLRSPVVGDLVEVVWPRLDLRPRSPSDAQAVASPERVPVLVPGRTVRLGLTFVPGGFLLEVWQSEAVGTGRLLAALGVNVPLPVTIGPVRVEVGVAPEHRRGTEVLAPLDGCKRAWRHSALGFVSREGSRWVGPGEAGALGIDGVGRFAVAVHAAAQPVGEGSGGCEAEPIVAWSVARLGDQRPDAGK